MDCTLYVTIVILMDIEFLHWETNVFSMLSSIILMKAGTFISNT